MVDIRSYTVAGLQSCLAVCIYSCEQKENDCEKKGLHTLRIFDGWAMCMDPIKNNNPMSKLS